MSDFVFTGQVCIHERLCGAARVVKTDHTLGISDFPALLKEPLLR